MNKVKREPLTDSDRALVEVLVRTDTPFPPLRQHHWRPGRAGANRDALIGQFFERGVQLASGGDGSANVERQRLLDALRADGFVTIARAERIKAPWLKLTDAGESRARSLVGLKSLRDSLAWLKQLAALSQSDWIWEGAFGEYTEAGVQATIERSLPAMVRGWAESSSTILGHAGYRVTEAGITALALRAPAAVKSLYHPDANNLYADIFLNSREALATAKIADPGEIGAVPLRIDLITHMPDEDGDE